MTPSVSLCRLPLPRALHIRSYYNFRQDPINDLQLFLFINTCLLGLASLVRGTIVRAFEGRSAVAVDGQPSWWADLYQVRGFGF